MELTLDQIMQAGKSLALGLEEEFRQYGAKLALSDAERMAVEGSPGTVYYDEQGNPKTTEPEEQAKPKTPPTIAIIGGGPGGLFTAHLLNKHIPDAKVTIFEASKRIAGKIKTDKFADGTPFEAGVAELYEYLGPGERDPMRELIEDALGLETVDMAGGIVVLGEQVIADLDDLEKKHGKKTRKAVEDFHKLMVKHMPLEKYAHRWQPDNEHPWADKTFHECLLEEIPDDPVARAYITTAVHSDLATEPHTCNGLNAIKNILMDNEDYMKLYHIVGGIEELPKKLKESIKADIRLKCPVTKVEKEGDGYRLHFGPMDDSQTQDFDTVFVCLPNHWLQSVCWCDETLTEAIQEVCQHYDLPAHYLRITLEFLEPWWKDLDLGGSYWMMDVFNGCCAYNESERWNDPDAKGHILSFLLGGTDAMLMCSQNQSSQEIIDCLLSKLPKFMAEKAKDTFLEGQVDRYVGAINAQPGGWPVEDLKWEHWPEPKDHPGIFLVGDYFFDSTLNAALISATTAVGLLCELAGIEDGPAEML